MKIEDYRLHLETQDYCIVHIHLIIDVAIVSRDDSPLSSMGECGSRPSVRETSVEAEQGSQEACHPAHGGEG